jgi:peptidoglycan/xylan/chitin deacetylase (PgdA/CDA1 family)
MAPYRTIAGVVAAVAFTTFISCSNKSSKSAKTCAKPQALQNMALRGTSLEPKTLALTFDDGPGLRTKQLSLYLKNEGIQAAFFVNGRNMGADGPEILQALVNDGHLVANHTETHRSLTGVSTATARPTDAEILQEVSDTDGKIDPFIPTKRFLFRPPFGDYDDTTFAALSNTPMNKYIGPILWDVGDQLDEAGGRAADWDCWQDGTDAKRLPMKVCGDLYLTETRRANRGIILMHDPYYNELDPEQLGTVDMVMYMVPILKQEGYTFIRVDKIPEISALLPALPPEGTSGPPNTAAGPGQGQGDPAPSSPTTPADDDPCR